MATIDELSQEFSAGLVDMYKEIGLDALCWEMGNRIERMKSAILTAWYAEYGFSPGKAVLVEERSLTGFKMYVRESTKEENDIAQRDADKQNVDINEIRRLLEDIQARIAIFSVVGVREYDDIALRIAEQLVKIPQGNGENGNSNKLTGCGVYSESGIVINDDGSSTLVENGVEKKLDAKGTSDFMHNLMSSGNSV